MSDVTCDPAPGCDSPWCDQEAVWRRWHDFGAGEPRKAELRCGFHKRRLGGGEWERLQREDVA